MLHPRQSLRKSPDEQPARNKPRYIMPGPDNRPRLHIHFKGLRLKQEGAPHFERLIEVLFEVGLDDARAEFFPEQLQTARTAMRSGGLKEAEVERMPAQTVELYTYPQQQKPEMTLRAPLERAKLKDVEDPDYPDGDQILNFRMIVALEDNRVLWLVKHFNSQFWVAMDPEQRQLAKAAGSNA